MVARNLDPLDSGGAVDLHGRGRAGAEPDPEPRRDARHLRTLRTEAIGDTVEEGMRRVAPALPRPSGWRRTWLRRRRPATVNTPAERALAADGRRGGRAAVRRDLPPAMTCEDFGWFLKERPGAFVWIGNGPAEGGTRAAQSRLRFQRHDPAGGRVLSRRSRQTGARHDAPFRPLPMPSPSCPCSSRASTTCGAPATRGWPAFADHDGGDDRLVKNAPITDWWDQPPPLRCRAAAPCRAGPPRSAARPARAAAIGSSVGPSTSAR